MRETQSLPEHYPILVVDDHPVNLQVIGFLLKSLGMEYACLSSGSEAVERAKPDTFGAILMDVMMPRMDGYETTRLIRAQEFATGQHTPIIAVTALDVDMAREKCLAAGMDDFLTKPISKDVLRDRLERWLKMPVAALLNEFKEDLASANGNHDPINRERLKILYGTDELDGVLEMFVTVNGALLLELNGAIDAHDKTQVSRMAHELKGSAFSISAQLLADQARELERAARGNDWPRALQIYASLAVSFVKLQEQLNATH